MKFLKQNLFLLFLLLGSNTYAATLYVNHNATGANNGTSWTNAYTDLQVAMNAAAINDKIWVAAGTYRPTQKPTGVTTADDRLQTFYLNKNIKLYGGFVGTETALSQRNAATNVTILSGDIGIVGTVTDNCYHVFITKGLKATAVIDGFTIKDGRAKNFATPAMIYAGVTFKSGRGGGFYNRNSSPTLTNVTVSNNSACQGGGFCNSPSSPTLSNVTVSNNSANYGGGFYNHNSSPTLSNVTVSNNSAYSGGGFYNYYFSSPTLTNVTVSNNLANFNGGGFYNYSSSSPTLTNVTVSNNSAGLGGGFLNNYSSSPNIRNSIIWNNGSSEVSNNNNSTPTFYYSIVKGSGGSSAWLSSYGTDGGNNLDINPLFVSSTDFSLQNGSSAINAGNNAYNTTLTDLAGNPRIQGSSIDMGAYETTSTTTPRISNTNEEDVQESNEITIQQTDDFSTTVLVYPNPANDLFHIVLNSFENEIAHINIFSSVGILVYSKTATEQTTVIPTNDWTNGIYHIQIRTGEKMETRTVLINH